MSWQHVRGHDNLVRAFAGVVRRDRLGHAYLFTGPEGVGKRLFAGELAKALLCENPPRDAGITDSSRLEACDRCPACVQLEAGTHPDFMVVSRPEDSLEVSIDTVRELCRSLGLKPARGKGRIAIVDDADDLTGEAANCFLKTLEEPPPQSLLLLISANVDRQLATIVSRCQVIRFAPLAEALVAEFLRDQELAEPGLVERLARLSGGSPGKARALADPPLWEFRRSFIQGLMQPQPDSVGLAKEWTSFVEDAGKEAAAHRRRASLVLRLLIEFLHDAVSLSTGAAARTAEPDELPAMRQWVERVGTEQILEILDRCLEADAQIDRRVQLVLVLEGLMDAFVEKVAGCG